MRITSFILVLLLLVSCAAVAYGRPLPALSPTITFGPDQKTTAVELPWPSYGEAAIGTTYAGVLATHGRQTPLPTASVAKIMTALAVLKVRPLAAGQDGPTITMSPADVISYNKYVAEDGSVVRVAAGERLSEYQALAAMLLPSANNMADTLAEWAFGSIENYDAYANQYAAELGLDNTRFSTDASGFSPNTVSTAQDLLKLGQAAMRQPVLAQIVSLKQVTLPVAGTIQNVNYLLGQDGIVGIKTGNTDHEGGAYLFAAKYSVGNKPITILGVIMGAPNLFKALHDAVPLLLATQKNFESRTLVKKGQAVGYYTAPWGGRVEAVAKQQLSTVAWNGQPSAVRVVLLSSKSPLVANQVIGSIESSTIGGSKSSVDVVTTGSLDPPAWQWRLKHPLR